VSRLVLSRGARLKPLSPKKATTVSVLDIGSTKITCLIANLRPIDGSGLLPNRTHTAELVGFGHQRSRGVKGGSIVDMDAAEQAIRLAVDAAERMSGLTVESLIVNLTCGKLASEAYAASVSIGGHEVEDADIARVLEAGSAHSIKDGRSVVHALPIGFSLDEAHGIRDPRGMLGEALGVDMHVVTAESAPVRNILLCVERCHLHVDAAVASPYAAGLAALVDDEAELGAAVVDMGGGTTSLAVFHEGRFVHASVIKVGGDHVTNDIARGLGTPIAHAERLKTLHGSPLPCPSDEREFLTVPHTGEHDDVPSQVPRSALVRIIKPRLEETLELVRDRLVQSGFAGTAGRCVVLTGGASQLTGATEVARRILGKQVRIGRPLGISGLPESAKGPAFSAAVGLAVYPQVAQIEQLQPRRMKVLATGTGGPLRSIRDWFRDSF
jgi:cell division protein FtsA